MIPNTRRLNQNLPQIISPNNRLRLSTNLCQRLRLKPINKVPSISGHRLSPSTTLRLSKQNPKLGRDVPMTQGTVGALKISTDWTLVLMPATPARVQDPVWQQGYEHFELRPWQQLEPKAMTAAWVKLNTARILCVVCSHTTLICRLTWNINSQPEKYVYTLNPKTSFIVSLKLAVGNPQTGKSLVR